MDKLVGRGSFGMRMEISMKVSGNSIRQMVLERTYMQMELSMLDIGKTICNMAKGKRLGSTDHLLKGSMLTEKNKVKALIDGLITQVSLVDGQTIK